MKALIMDGDAILNSTGLLRIDFLVIIVICCRSFFTGQFDCALSRQTCR